MVTKKLYNEEPYLSSFKAKVTVKNGVQIQLDRTAFYPKGGGQIGDTGVIDFIKVIDTQSINGAIIHTLESEPPFKEGDIVQAKLGWERRYNIMKLHSASHIMEHYLLEHYGPLERLGSSVDEKKDRSEYAYEGRFEVLDLTSIEDKVNTFLKEGHEITVKPEPTNPEMRVWRCGAIELYCGGTHVKNTIEIGRVKLKRKNPGKGKERVETFLID